MFSRLMQYICALIVGLALGAVLLSTSPDVANAQGVDPTTDATNEAPAASERVVVSPGDSLWSISERRLGKSATPPQIANGADLIYVLNREQIGANPGLILPGQDLVLPPSLRTEPQKVDRPPAEPDTTREKTRTERAAIGVLAGPRAKDVKTAKPNPGAADKAAPEATLPDAPQAVPIPTARGLTLDGPSHSPVVSFLNSLSSRAASAASALAGYYAVIREDANGRWLLGLTMMALGLLAASLAVWKLFAEQRRGAPYAEVWRPYYSPLLGQPTDQQGPRHKGRSSVVEAPATIGPKQRPSGVEDPAPENDTSRVGLVGTARFKRRLVRDGRVTRSARLPPRQRLSTGARTPEVRRSLRAARVRGGGRS